MHFNCLPCFNLKESSFCIFSFKTEYVRMPAIFIFASFYFFHIEFIFAANRIFSILFTLYNPNIFISRPIFKSNISLESWKYALYNDMPHLKICPAVKEL